MLTDTCSSVRNISILNSPLISDTGMKYLTTFRRLQKIQIEGRVRLTKFCDKRVLNVFEARVSTILSKNSFASSVFT